MKVLVLGCNGQLGVALTESIPDEVELAGLDLPDLDITNADALLRCCREARPAVIINAAAYTAVDKAEAEVERAAAVNIEGPRNIALAARAVCARVIHISTDFVFDGSISTPYEVDATTRPLNVYGQTKRDGELAVLAETSGAAIVVRTSWLYGATGSNFVKTMLRLMNERDELRVVADQTGTPTWSMSLARAIWVFVNSPRLSGVFHWADGGQTTWRGFAAAIQEEALALGLLTARIPIHAIATKDYPAAARRPSYSVLDCASTRAALNLRQEQWRVNLHQMLEGMSGCRSDPCR